MTKGIDPKFVHYGIRADGLAMIEAICETEGFDFEWMSGEILKAYHAKKVDVIEMRSCFELCGNKYYIMT